MALPAFPRNTHPEPAHVCVCARMRARTHTHTPINQSSVSIIVLTSCQSCLDQGNSHRMRTVDAFRGLGGFRQLGSFQRESLSASSP